MSLILLGLFVGHVLADFVFQPKHMSEYKKRCFKRAPGHAPWWMWLGAHGVTHGFAVWYVTGSLPLAFAEVVAHSLIDFGKCEGHYGVLVDQTLHLACKLLWAYILVYHS
jgi:hypothetical protein